MSAPEVDLNLNDLVPESKHIKFGNPEKSCEVKQPTTNQLLRLMKLGQKMQRTYDPKSEADVSTEEMEADLDALTVVIKEIIPELAQEQLNFAQVTALSKMISKMAIPSQVQALKDQGIEIAEDVEKNA